MIAGKITVENKIKEIQDCTLRVTLQMLYTLINEPGVYSLKELSEKLGYNIQPAIVSFLNQNVFEFYSGNTRITLDNAGKILRIDSKEKLIIITRIDIKDQRGFEAFTSLMEDYKKVFSKRKKIEEIVAFHSFMITDSNEEFRVDQSIVQLLAEAKTAEYELTLDGIRFYPIAVYKSRKYDREYFVALKEEKGRTLIKFFPCENSRRVGSPSPKYVQISDVYSNLDAVEIAKEKLKLLWGPNDFYLDEEPLGVDAIIYDESCIGKIEHDISNYIHELIKNNDNTYSLKLKVLGYEMFRTWVLSYGSSIEIKGPKGFRDDLKKTLRKIRDSYLKPKTEKNR